MTALMEKAGAASGLVPDSHFPGKARNVIFLFMEGAVSQVDSFDYKPLLEKHHGEDPRKAIGKLEKTQFELTTYNSNGEVLIQRSGQQFISRANGRFYGGAEQFSDWTGQSGNSNDSPVDFSFPGQPGFGATEPQYDCDMMMAQAAPGGGA